MKVRRTSVAIAAVAVAVGGSLTGPASAAAPDVCAGVSGCRVVANEDVDGDGSPDAIGVAFRGAEGAERGEVAVRVMTEPGTIVSVTRPTEFWYGPPFQGAAPVDGRPGNEIFVGRLVGAHTEYFRALTWRAGKLVDLDAPGEGHFWVVDGAYSVVSGWLKVSTDPDGVVYRRVASRVGDTDTFRGSITKYRSTGTAWTRLWVHDLTVSEKVAGGWVGFRVGGLQRY
jgi:hypothetical protein